ncbi:DUF397 domain-containing protein [Streptomyces alkaliphilus]|uniref:DUF397 domain-containing protein n=1 Tax=Streptomyces alkaliphilus TaxID=1472722 RepID=A0A7W3TEA1_9ACTN|nr:DUF397 domain-containing protein [Streptomyces alkaliphilus]MBB0244935.1 DUF397 domain-containing protein [Streptomyces alkaliphilus]
MSVTIDPRHTQWVKSTYSGGNGGQCVEWAPGRVRAGGVVPVRDSKNPRGPHLHLALAGWTDFVTALRDGDLDPG